MAKGTVLVADDDSAIRTVLNQALARAGYIPRTTSNAASLWRWVQQGEGDVIITDVVMPDENAFELLPRIRRLRPELPIIVMSAQNTLMTALKAAERGAFEYLPKPFDLNELITIVGRAMAEPKPASKRAEKADVDGEELPLIGRSIAMQEIYRVLARLTQTDLTVMINGESGTGKELVARVLHDHGKRRHGPFVPVNMAAIPRDLIESELFGHEKGALTGAQARRLPGRFEQADGGTLFLDEIGDMPLDAQTRLLRVLQEGEYTTVGGHTPIKTHVRIIAATHRDLRALIQQGLFREDLFYRLNVVPLRLPPLRERLDDIGDLTRHFLRGMARQTLGQHAISNEAIERLKQHAWPGNVRELENLIHRIVAVHPQELISADVVDQELIDVISGPSGAPEEADAQSLTEMVERHLATYFANYNGNLPPPGLYDRVIREIEVPLISAALTATRGNQIRAAELLGLNRNTLRSRIKLLNIQIFKSSSF
ncbi:MAG: two-component system nitrogen regulation response regulator GlnG [Hyphomicrobiaceae bacterium]|jgi:two-component system nitrogen regulation response regulator GlnG